MLKFSVDCLKFLGTIPYKKEYDVFRYQLSRSATSIGANYEESQACSRKEFIARISICLREARETKYWFNIIKNLDIGNKETVAVLYNEITEITNIFGAILVKSRTTKS